MPPDPAAKVPRSVKAVLAAGAVVMVAFGLLVGSLPSPLIQPVISLGLGSGNLLAFLLLLQRAREGGDEQKGWRLLTASFACIMAANGVLMFTPSPLTEVSPMEKAFFALQPLIAVLQAWALFSWPFRSRLQGSQRIQNILGSLIFGGSLFLLLWIVALWQEWDHGQWPIYVRMLGLALRATIMGGITTYILAEDPRRVRGPLGWFFAAAVATVALVVLARPYLYDAFATMQPTPLFGLVFGAAFSFSAAAWLRAPVEVPEDQPRLRFPMVEGLIYLPFAAVGGMLILSALQGRDHILVPAIGFVVVSALLLVRQFMLLREVRRANELLEERVAARTRSLEELQGIVLRTERLNSIGALGAGLAHDLNNALTGVRAFAELSRMKVEEGQMPSPSDLDRILVAAEQSTALTGRLMAFARQEEETMRPLDLVEEVSNLEGILRMLLGRNVTLTLDLGHVSIPILGSRAQIEQILVNLVGNARDAMPRGGTIRVAVQLDLLAGPPVAGLEVADTGEGMTPEVQARLFQPFFTTKRPGKGTGLGLASVKHLVEAAGGTIQVHSQPGRGTRFLLGFPLHLG